MDEATLDKIMARIMHATIMLEEALAADMVITGRQLAGSVTPPKLWDDENGMNIARLIGERLVGEHLGREATEDELEKLGARMEAMLDEEDDASGET